MAKKKSVARLDREIAVALGKDSKLWPAGAEPTDLIIQRARDAERKLAEIARTRRPTEAETAEAHAAYAAAARVSAATDPDDDRRDDDRFDREWKRLARQSKTDSFGGAAYRRVKSDWISAGRPAKALKEFIRNRADSF